MKTLLKTLLFFVIALGLPAMARGQQYVQNISGTVSVPVWTGSSFKLILGANVASFSFAGPPISPGQLVTIYFLQDATGSRTVTFASNIFNSCTITSTAASTTVCQFAYDQFSNSWFGVGASGGGGSGNTTSTSLTANFLPKANGANSIINSTLSDNGTTVSTTEPLSVGASVTTTADGVHPSRLTLVGNTTLPSLTANTVTILGFPAATNTAWSLQVPTAIPMTTDLFSCVVTSTNCLLTDSGIPSGNVVTLAGTQTLTSKTIAGAAITGALTGTGNFIPVTLLNSGSSASSSTFWRGDGTWATPAGGSGNPAIIANDTTTGTTVNQIAVWNAGGTGAVVATAAAQGSTGNSFIGICASGCGTSGNASIVTAGYVQCTSDNAATMGHYAVQGSTGVFGECHDSGVAFGSTPPTYSIGVFTTTGAAGLQGLNLRADANQFLGTLRLYGILGDGPGVFNAALSYDNNNSNFTAGWNVGGNTAYGALTGGQNNINSMMRGILTITSGNKSATFNWPAGGGSGQTYGHAPICNLTLVETTQGTVPADGGHAVFTSATLIQVDSTNAAPAAGWVYNYHCDGNPN